MFFKKTIKSNGYDIRFCGIKVYSFRSFPNGVKKKNFCGVFKKVKTKFEKKAYLLKIKIYDSVSLTGMANFIETVNVNAANKVPSFVKAVFDVSDCPKATGKFLVSCRRSLTTVRNNCVHYNRLWDFRLPIKAMRVKNPTKLSKYNYMELTERNDQDFFAPFYIISLFLCVIAPDSKFCSLIRGLINRYIEKTNSKLTYGRMGFPFDWEKLPLFEKMLKNESKGA